MTLTAPPPPSAAVPDEGCGDLLRRVADGDRACFAQLYDLFAGRIFGLLTRVAHGVTAERLLVEVFDEVWRTARTCPSFDEAEDWILFVARRRAVVAARARRG
ncbi:hypothetical protein [Microbacterium sp. 10M-3C3]|uniref:hypothetical protein n=1 Tax=Microbacterium sp. 10M-3C3 TaxID=2483401 RepID=UPI000F6329B4|nr:hypothetical protein [Microbacterium sp. 10M-3C3]